MGCFGRQAMHPAQVFPWISMAVSRLTCGPELQPASNASGMDLRRECGGVFGSQIPGGNKHLEPDQIDVRPRQRRQRRTRAHPHSGHVWPYIARRASCGAEPPGNPRPMSPTFVQGGASRQNPSQGYVHQDLPDTMSAALACGACTAGPPRHTRGRLQRHSRKAPLFWQDPPDTSEGMSATLAQAA